MQPIPQDPSLPDKWQEWEKSKAWADRHLPEAMELIRDSLSTLVEIVSADEYLDQHHATDFVAHFRPMEVACRIRSDRCQWRELTLRHSRLSGSPTETIKLLKGGPRWYFYAWANSHRIRGWLLIDLDVVRRARLIERAITSGHEVFCRDGSFIWISLAELHRCGAIQNSRFGR